MENRDYNAPEGDYVSPEQENTENPYSRPNYETAEEYNQARRETEAESFSYGQNYGNTYNTQYGNQQYNGQPYGNNMYGNGQYANLGGIPVDAYGNPLKSHFAVQLVFAIIEIVCCCLSPIAMILGIIALVFAIQANSAYNLGRGEEFKAKSKTTNILLIIGGVFAGISLLINVAVFALLPNVMKETYNYFEEYEEEMMNDFFDEEGDGLYEEYCGTDENPLADNCSQFTLNGVAYELPMTYSEFLQMGYILEELEEGYIFEEETFSYFSIADAEGNYVGSVRISNDTEDDLTVEDCVIDYIDLYNDAVYDSDIAPLPFTFGNGLDINASYEELKAWLGEPYYMSEETIDDTVYRNYMWVYNGDDKYQCVDIYFEDGVISSLSIEEYDIVY